MHCNTCILLLSLLLLNEIGSARLRESDIHPITPKTPAPHNQSIYRNKTKGKIVEDYSRDRTALANKTALALFLKQHWPCSRMDQGLCYCNSNAWGWHISHQSGHKHYRSAYFPEWKKAPKCTGGTITGPKHFPAAPDTTLTSLLIRSFTITCCDRFDRNYG